VVLFFDIAAGEHHRTICEKNRDNERNHQAHRHPDPLLHGARVDGDGSVETMP
jgi:hypothetical protein